MPRDGTACIADKRVIISLAALLVNVTAKMPPGVEKPCCNSHAMRVVSTRVLPEPAPAKMSACSAGNVTAAFCSWLRVATKGDAADGNSADEKDMLRL